MNKKKIKTKFKILYNLINFFNHKKKNIKKNILYFSFPYNSFSKKVIIKN